MTRFYTAALALLAWLPAAVFAQTITSFSPASGNVGTLVTLTGTDLNLVTAVTVNGTAGLLLDRTSTTLRLLVMPGATSGTIATTGGTPAGSASVFTVTQTALSTAQQGPKLVGTGAVGLAGQGKAVALSADGNTLAVGAEEDDSQVGAVWVFTRSGTGWNQQGPKLVGTGAVGARIYQGTSVALSADGNTLAVGAEEDDSQVGAVWVFTRSGTNWTQQGGKLVGTGVIRTAGQGGSVALSADGNTLAVGGHYQNNLVGAVWVFVRSGTSWTQQGGRLGGTAGNVAGLGVSVALSADGNTLAAGADRASSNTGSTLVYTRSGMSWTQQSVVLGTGAAGLAGQGKAVALSADGNTLAVGGTLDNVNTGATWVFTRSGTGWTQQGPKLVGTGKVGAEVYQGFSVALSADGNALAMGGSNDNRGVGATWVFTRSGTSWTQQGSKLVGTGGTAGFSYQSYAVALSADGTTLAMGRESDDGQVGATWVFSTASSLLAQRPAAGLSGGARFFPNPFTEHLTVTGGAGTGTLRLFDGTGRTRLTGAYHDGWPLDLSALPAGLYWLQLDQAPARPLLKQ